MSWQSYVDDQLLAAGFMYASINGHDGSKWASSPGYEVQVGEAKKLASVMESGDFSTITGGGFFIAGQKYAFTRGETSDDNDGMSSCIQGRCKEEGKASQGIIVYCTTQALIIGVHDPAYSNGASFGKVNTDIGRVADYMMENGF